MKKNTVKEFVNECCSVHVEDGYRTLVYNCGESINEYADKYLPTKEYFAFKALQGFDESFQFHLSFEDGYDEDCITYQLTDGEDEYINEFDDDVTMLKVYKTCINFMLKSLDNQYLSLVIDSYIEGFDASKSISQLINAYTNK